MLVNFTRAHLAPTNQKTPQEDECSDDDEVALYNKCMNVVWVNEDGEEEFCGAEISPSSQVCQFCKNVMIDTMFNQGFR